MSLGLSDTHSPLAEEPVEETAQYRFSRPLVTPILIGSNILIFVIMIAAGVPFFDPKAGDLLSWGANFGPLTMSGQWWRLLTACFLHFGVIHIAVNMYILFQVGMFTERLFGRWLFLLLYLLAGIGGNIAGLFFHPLTVSAGASGAIFGVYGGLLAFLLTQRGVISSDSAKGIARSAMIFLGYNLVYGLANPHTDLVAHVGGLVCGFLAGCVLSHPLRIGSSSGQLIRGLAGAAGGTLLALAAVSFLPKASASRGEFARELATGSRVTAGVRDVLIYNGTATQQQAEKLAQTLVNVGIFRAPDITLLFNKTAGGSTLSFLLHGRAGVTSPGQQKPAPTPGAVAAEPWNDPKLLGAVRALGPQLAPAAGGLPFTIRLLDSDGEVKNQIAITTTEVALYGDRVSYSGEATAEQAMSLASALRAAGFFRGSGTLVFLAGHNGIPEIAFQVTEGSWNDPRFVAYLTSLSGRVASAVSGHPLHVRLIGRDGQTHRELISSRGQ